VGFRVYGYSLGGGGGVLFYNFSDASRKTCKFIRRYANSTMYRQCKKMESIISHCTNFKNSARLCKTQKLIFLLLTTNSSFMKNKKIMKNHGNETFAKCV
jgi:hypothetical protein